MTTVVQSFVPQSTPVAYGVPRAGAGGTIAAGWIPNLSATYQPLDATLTAFAGLTIVANSVTIGTGADAFSQITVSANQFLARASTGNLEAKTISNFGLSLVDDADGSAGRTTLGVGTGDSPVFAGLGVGTVTGTSGQYRQGPTTARYLRQILSADATQIILEQDGFHDSGSASLQWRYFRNVNLTGAKAVIFFRGDNSTTTHARIGVDGGNSFFALGGGNLGCNTSSFGTTQAGAMSFGNGTKPTTFPTAGIMGFSGEMEAWDTTGNFTVFSNHRIDEAIAAGIAVDPDDMMPDIYYCQNVYLGVEKFRYTNPTTGKTQTVVRPIPGFKPRDWDADQEAMYQQSVEELQRWESEKSEAAVKATKITGDALREKRELTEDESMAVRTAESFVEPPVLYEKRQPPNWLKQRIEKVKSQRPQ